ncbi:hypothetical protein HCN51_13295 [Nonomuraea sp. FMUSA5-5]|uniref:Uncharacterized protein n=1 Tax=Nonomuraea composti TaxID=2720023 RepID=A0ABX1B1Q5_9ACTN|nr:hypothetical protein [Nonomuraea sp. FMUSA5-5]NJP90417.1 hypothetical protein [Nonomuraea sp. FMUSA5-5]
MIYDVAHPVIRPGRHDLAVDVGNRPHIGRQNPAQRESADHIKRADAPSSL